MTHDVFDLQLPAASEHLGTARSFAAAVARHYDVGGETVEDLKIAISEACVDALVAGSPIWVRAEEVGNAVSFAVEAPEGEQTAEQQELDDLGAPARLELIRSLFPDTSVQTHDGRRVILFQLLLS